MAHHQSPRRLVGPASPPTLAQIVRSALLILACGTTVMQALPVHAQTTATQADGRHSYRIGRGPLDDALANFAAAAGVSVTVPPQLVAGKSSGGVDGRYTVEEGFARLLAGSGLYVEAVSGGAYVLHRLPDGQGSGGVSTLSAVVVTARGLDTEGSHSYAAPGASIMKSAQSLRDIPQSLTVVTRQRMDDFNLNTLEDVLSQTTGLSLETLGAGNKLFASRGFEMRNMQVDGVSKGFWGGTSAMGIQPDMAMYDRVEVLRGAAGLLLGNGTPGGTVNFVRKRPLAERYVGVELQAGSWDYYRGMLDVASPLNDDGSVRARAVMSYEDRGYYTSKTETRQPFFYGVLEYDITPQTQLTLGGRYQHFRKDGAYWYGGLPSSTDGSDLELKRSTSFGPSWAFYKAETQEFFAEAKHDFNARWALKVSGTYQKTQRSDSTLWLRGSANPQTLTGAYLVASSTPEERLETRALDANVTGSFDLLGREHSVVLGANWLEELGKGASVYDYANPIPLDLNDPHQRNVSEKDLDPDWTDDRTVSQGVYGSLGLQLADPVKLVLGGRLSWYDYKDRLSPNSSFKQSRQFTPYAGVLVDVTPEWTAYASYADIFEPQSQSRTVSGSSLKPAIGSNYELGIKGELLDGRLNTSLAMFYIRQNDRAMVDPENSSGCPGSPSGGACYINAGKVESKGIEAEINGEIVPGLQAWLGYTYNHQVYLKDRDSKGQPSSNEGQAFSSITPRHIFRAGASYRLPGELNKLTLGAGVTAQSSTGYLSGKVWREQTGYAVWNAFARYQIDPRWSLSLNVDNLFDRSYYTSPGQNVYGEPRRAMVSLRGRF
ncbi:TonB-dependent siderophore receptor [Alcaligenes faecalis]|uniref:TonB-dependent siderophore receptor n=1 Tax=Alcaligenes faecalis TaxID=511 RepID=UPI000F6609D3|nr:TonB-dependent receptor [Alcaligenes faecalis]MBQ0216852.1 TonB-dependent siderophore receptor [Alcaligenes faecalis]RSE62301.1 TonB-dependent siderophore receptor [Alcaligenes faecalis]